MGEVTIGDRSRAPRLTVDLVSRIFRELCFDTPPYGRISPYALEQVAKRKFGGINFESVESADGFAYILFNAGEKVGTAVPKVLGKLGIIDHIDSMMGHLPTAQLTEQGWVISRPIGREEKN